jgi:hypothetical protein
MRTSVGPFRRVVFVLLVALSLAAVMPHAGAAQGNA